MTHKQTDRNVLDKRMEDNETALRVAFENGIEFVENIKTVAQKRLVDRKKFENQCDEGKRSEVQS